MFGIKSNMKKTCYVIQRQKVEVRKVFGCSNGGGDVWIDDKDDSDDDGDDFDDADFDDADDVADNVPDYAGA